MSTLRKIRNFSWRLLVSILFLVLLIYFGIYLIAQIADGQQIIYPLVVFWALLAYIVLPRIHRFFTKIYLPSYYIGRTRTGDGFYGDPVNIALIGSAANLHKAMREAGWTRAEDLSMKSSLKMMLASIRNKSYKTAPVSNLYLFSVKQNFAYQQEVNGNPRIRHHIRFWKTPRNWWLPGGHKVDWLAAATFDKHVGFSAYTGQITHKISDDIDTERDYVIDSLHSTRHIQKVEVIEHFTSAFHSRNGGGDRIRTDGALPFVHLQ